MFIKPPIKNSFYQYNLSDVKASASKELFTVMTTFAGGGGSSTGYKLAGGKILVANEFIPTAVETYKANYPETPVIPLDIRKITRRGGKKEVLKFLKPYGIEFGSLDILDGSPPCTTFSTATAGRGFEKIEKKDSSTANNKKSKKGLR
jgi:DNA (cytosine-5)-methyltransferase 1